MVDVAWETGENPKETRVTLNEFLRQVIEHLAKGRRVHLDGLGSLQASLCKGVTANLTSYGGIKKMVEAPHALRVSFRKAAALKESLMNAQKDNDEGMDKYAVDETTKVPQDQLEKRAQKGCPECGRELKKHGSVLLCPVHGSEPFEKE